MPDTVLCIIVLIGSRAELEATLEELEKANDEGNYACMHSTIMLCINYNFLVFVWFLINQKLTSILPLNLIML